MYPGTNVGTNVGNNVGNNVGVTFVAGLCMFAHTHPHAPRTTHHAPRTTPCPLCSEKEFAERVTFSTRFGEFMRQQRSIGAGDISGKDSGSREAALLATTLEQKSGGALARMALKFDQLANRITSLPEEDTRSWGPGRGGGMDQAD